MGELPQEGRELYELQYGARAGKMLDEALATNNTGNLADISRCFFYTRSGSQATFLLGLYHLEHGQPLAGALALERLRQAGKMAEEFEPALSLSLAACWLRLGDMGKARQSLIALEKRDSMQTAIIAGREVPLFADQAQAIEWLQTLIGHQTLAVSPQGDRPLSEDPPLLSARWRVPIADNPFFEAALRQYQRLLKDHENGSAIPTLHPLPVGDVLLMRTLRQLQAVDLLTGKRLWDSPPDQEGELTYRLDDTQKSQIAAGIAQRTWDDLAYGRLTSDGRRVFSIEDPQTTDNTSGGIAPGLQVIAGALLRGVRIFGNQGNQAAEYSWNRLAARDIRTGKLEWELGGRGTAKQPDTFFFGPPLPLIGQLYVLAEAKGEIQLLALDPATGNKAWCQPIATPPMELGGDDFRRWAGMSPVYADGILICPTYSGAVVGYDLATRSFLWGYRYAEKPEERTRTLSWRADQRPATAWAAESLPWASAACC